MKKHIYLLLVAIVISFSFSACNLAIPTSGQFTDGNENPSTLMFTGNADDINLGELYYQSLGSEKEKISDNVQKDEFMLLSNSQAVLYLDKDNILYYKQQGKEKEKISDSVIKSSFSYSSDEKTIAFLKKVDDTEETPAELYIKKVDSEKEKITSDMNKDSGSSNYSMSSDASSIYFLNKDGVLYKKTATSDKEKIASDISNFSINSSGSSYTYLNKQKSYYVKWSNDSEAQKVATENVGNLKLSENGYIAVFTGSYNYEKGLGELYVVIKGSDAIKIASDVKYFNLTSDGKNLYYFNDEGAVYLKTLPTVTDATYKNQSKFVGELNKSQKIKLCSDVSKFEVSANGKNCVLIDNDNNLYVSYNQQEKVKVASDVTKAKVFTETFLYLNKEKQLFLNSKISDLKNIKDNNKMIAQRVTAFATSAYGKYVVFATDEDTSISLCVDGQKPEILISQSEGYDKIFYKQYPVYEKKLKLSDIVGIYKNEALGAAYKISGEGVFTTYENGVEKESVQIKINGIDKLTANLTTDKKDSIFSQNAYDFTCKLDGVKLLSISGQQYNLTIITDAELTKELERQIKVEAQRKADEERKAAEEKRKAELEQKKATANARGSNYLSNGVYVAAYQTLYYSPNYSSASTLYFTTSGNKSVYDYDVSSDGSTLWLKISGGTYGYFWVCE